jgi:hypothetical protein
MKDLENLAAPILIIQIPIHSKLEKKTLIRTRIQTS